MWLESSGTLRMNGDSEQPKSTAGCLGIVQAEYLSLIYGKIYSKINGLGANKTLALI